MGKRRRHFVPILLTAFLIIDYSMEAATRTLQGHIPALAKTARRIGRLAPEKELRLSVGLKLRNTNQLEALLKDIYDPKSPAYHSYLSPQEFADRFAPTPTEYEAVVGFARSHQLSITRLHENRVLVEVSGTVAAIEQAFHFTMNEYRGEHRNFFSPDQEPTVEAELSILDIAGLSDAMLPRPLTQVTAFNEASPFAATGSAPGGFFIGRDFRDAYGVGVTNDGSGQTIGLFELDGYFTNDITRYLSDAGMGTNVALENVYVDGFDGTPGSANIEVAMNIQLCLAMAPGLQKVIVYQGPNINNVSTPNAVLNRMAIEDRAKQLSCSWGFSINATTEQIFQQFAAQGQSIFQASSDSGAYSGAVVPPCDNPYVTSVGATALTTSSSQWISESVWSGTGGGVSTVYPIPSWQAGINMAGNQGSTTMRNFPDVSMIGEYIYVRAWDGNRYVAHGTSASAPLWAGLMALINQRAEENGSSPIGFLNPSLYNLAKDTAYPTLFHDITQGNNTNSSNPTKFFSTSGYDLCSGWGTPQINNLMTAMVPFNPLRISHLNGLSITGTVEAPFPSSALFITNSGNSPIAWAVSNSPSWLKTSTTSGVIGAGLNEPVVISPTYEAQYLTPGQYVANLSFISSGVNAVQHRTITLTVIPILQNGDFEAGTFLDWTLSGTTNENLVASTNSTFPAAVHSGVWGAALGQGGSLGSLFQTIPTSPGKRYLLSFWLNSSDNPTPPRKTTPNQFMAQWDGATLFNQIDLPVFGWSNLTFVVTATTTNTLLRFDFRNDPWAFGLDDVAVQPVPPPAFTAWNVTNNAFRLTWLTVAGVKYQLQSNQDLLNPGWTNEGTPFTATNSSMTLSRPLGQNFYRVAIVPGP